MDYIVLIAPRMRQIYVQGKKLFALAIDSDLPRLLKLMHFGSLTDTEVVADPDSVAAVRPGRAGKRRRRALDDNGQRLNRDDHEDMHITACANDGLETITPEGLRALEDRARDLRQRARAGAANTFEEEDLAETERYISRNKGRYGIRQTGDDVTKAYDLARKTFARAKDAVGRI
ncbi:MAG TPA: hypothetical protein VFL28_07315 [bacterium]|jgi:hypothetical protein|nr:hypothetical protein [bacterium]